MGAKKIGGRTIVLSVVIGLIGLSGPTSASAATQLGTTVVPNDCGMATVLQITSTGASYTAPIDGVLTAWSYRAAAAVSTTVRLKVGTFAPGAPGTMTISGQSEPQLVPANTASTFSTRVRINAGETIGVAALTSAPMTMICLSGNPAGNAMAFAGGDDVQPGTPTPASTQNFYVADVAATLEPDADNDGFGDETQDGCPTEASVQDACPVAPDTTAPDTTITGQPKAKTKKKAATFTFTSSEPGSSFECSLNGVPFTTCTSPLTVKGKKGKNHFEVRAKDAAGNADPTPATTSFTV